MAVDLHLLNRKGSLAVFGFWRCKTEDISSDQFTHCSVTHQRGERMIMKIIPVLYQGLGGLLPFVHVECQQLCEENAMCDS